MYLATIPTIDYEEDETGDKKIKGEKVTGSEDDGLDFLKNYKLD